MSLSSLKIAWGGHLKPNRLVLQNKGNHYVQSVHILSYRFISTCSTHFFQSVVSASSDPDTFIVRNEYWKDVGNALTLEETRLGTKKSKIEMAEGQGKSTKDTRKLGK